LKRNSIILGFASVLATLIVAEIVLRFIGYEPGRIYYAPWFKPVDSLVVQQYSFEADDDGITRMNSEAKSHIETSIKIHDSTNTSSHSTFSEVNSLIHDFRQLVDGDVKNELADRYKQVKENHVVWFDSLILDYVQSPLNENGFKSIVFRQTDSSRKKILVIGDSHAFGHSCKNVTSSFADILLAKGYVVYNTGLSGADPAQYQAIAEKYIPMLKPDYVLVNLFLENDVVYYKRELKPNQPYLWVTNAGHLFACPEGVYFNSPTAAYNNMLRNYFIPATNWQNKLLASTTITTFVWRALQKYFHVVNNSTPEFRDYDEKVLAASTTLLYTNNHVQSILEVSKLSNAQCLVFTIPKQTATGLKKAKDFPLLLNQIAFYECDFKTDDYADAGGHLNDVGHNKFALFIDSLVSK
jgi:hypothetical protein